MSKSPPVSSHLIALALLLAGVVLVTVALQQGTAQGTDDAHPPSGSYSVFMGTSPAKDPAGHAQYIGMPYIVKLNVSGVGGEPGPPTITGGVPFVTVTEETGDFFVKDPVLGWLFALSGSGTVAGYDDVSVRFNGSFNNGTLSGEYTMGAHQELPGGQSIVYNALYTFATPTPPLTATPCPPGKVPIYLLPNLTNGCGTPTPSPTVIGAPTNTPEPTDTPEPTETPGPTGTATEPPAPTEDLCLMGSQGVAGSQSCTPTPAATPDVGESDIAAGCNAQITILSNGDIHSDDSIELDCHLQYNPNDLRPANPNAQTWFDANGIEVHSNGDITSVDMDNCTPVSFNLVTQRAVQALNTACTVVFRTFRNFGSGNSAGAPTPDAVYESEPITLTANASFPPFGAHWKAAPGTNAALTNTLSDTAAGFVTGWVIDMSPFGDVNCNFAANSIDAALLLQLVVALTASLPCQIAGDVDRDFHINAIDAALILQYTAGRISSLPTR